MRTRLSVSAALILVVVGALARDIRAAQRHIPMGCAARRAIADEPKPPPLGNPENKDVRRERSYSMQPPTIPHKIDNYQVDKNVNACLTCHSRGRAPLTQAVAVSVSHYMDRDGNFLAEISPRRYFCEQCHVAQVDARPLVENRFEDVDQIIKRTASKGAQPSVKKK